DDFLPKPINEPLLLARIEKSLRLRVRERAFRLLESLFPGRFLNTYLALGTVPPSSHEHVGVLFSDIVGFTEFSRNRRPEYVVGCLQRHVEHFEEAGVRHGVQKIKTIGDAYMGAVGLEDAVDRPAYNLVRFAEDVLRRIRASGSDFRVRVGIHVGPVTTGLLGRSRFTFDLWGETVNLAARMEQYGVPNRITLSEAASRQIADWAEFSDPTRIEDIHNVGRVPVFDFHRWTPAAPDD
ncbi:MAG TPA: adenylate/guanylate cyclase domain-containing protein, partial [Planctomycetia bacterium]|nr:adenylate/guanylate cyclase domain-containing protein [Planctomycetia bacterium]